MNLKNGILLKRAKRFFKENPDRNSAILKMSIGNVDTHWNVCRQKNQLNITEINSSKQKFVFKEDEKTGTGFGKFEPVYDPKKGKQGVSAAVTSPVKQPPPLPARQQQLAKRVERIAAGKNPFDRQVVQKVAQQLSDQEFGQYYGASKQSMTKQAGTPPPLPSRVAKAGTIPYGTGPYQKGGEPLTPQDRLAQFGREKTINAGIERKYRIVLSEADGDIKGIDQPEEEPEQSPEDLPITSDPAQTKTSEQQAVSRLSGQTIKSANVEFDENLGRLSLELAGHHQPVTLEWDKGGKVIFSYKGARYILRK